MISVMRKNMIINNYRLFFYTLQRVGRVWITQYIVYYILCPAKQYPAMQVRVVYIGTYHILFSLDHHKKLQLFGNEKKRRYTHKSSK